MTAIDDRLAALETANAKLRRELADCRAELAQAREQQTATAEVLQVINSSPGDITPMFDAILEKAHRLCGVAFGSLQLYDGRQFCGVASRGNPEPLEEALRQPHFPDPDSGSGALLRGERFYQVVGEAAGQSAVNPRAKASAEAGIRTILFIPLRKGGTLIGLITAARTEVRPFSEKEIALLENFAAQAVIAMENARLITETREALEQQTATAEVLQVINASPGNLAPVFDAMLEKAMALCAAAFGGLWTFDGDRYVATALRGVPDDYAGFLARTTLLPGPGSAPYRFLHGERSVIQNLDLANEEPYRAGDPQRRALVDLGGARTALQAPLRKDGAVLGVITIYRQEVRPFSEKQIALLQNFAAQAVIAMENARLITETREALEQQTATAEVLQVINSSPGDLAPVFEAMLEKAMRLCGAAFGALHLHDGEHFRAAATRGVPEQVASLMRQPHRPPDFAQPLLDGAPLVHLADAAAVAAPEEQINRDTVEFGGVRTLLIVPLRKDGALLGTISVFRQEVRLFTDKQIALLQNFAAQAVIAMENARLLTETREALAQQTATAEVLQAINASPGDLAPVFDAILEKAHTLCGADHGSLFLRDGDHFRSIAARGVPEEFAEHLRRGFQGNDTPLSERLLAGEPFVQIRGTALAERLLHRLMDAISSNRTVLSVPLRKSDELFGMIVAGRFAVQPFSNKQIALLQNFAAQAVIAMENARLITETREALEQQTATAEVLQVINSSPGDLAPVFQAMLYKAHTLCGASFGALMTYDGERFHAVAHQGTPAPFREFLASGVRPGPGDPFGRMAEGAALSHIHDLSEVAAQHPGEALPRAAVDLGGIRTLLVVPLRKDNALLGAITAYRQEVRPFTDKQIALLQNFAAQAVIAIENARLLGELRQRTGDLQESLVYQTAVSDVLKVISRSTFDLDAVLQAMVTTAIRLCRADHAVIYRNIDGEYRWAAGNSLPAEYERIERETRIRPGTGTLVGRVGLERSTVHILDAWTDPLYEAKEDARIGGVRTMLGVPLLRDGTVIGVIGLARARIEAYTEKEIELVATFADQAVIAIENARLLTETREALEQQTATAEVLQVINSSPGDLAPVFQALLDKALALCGAAFGVLWAYDGEQLRATALHGVPAAFAEFLTRAPHPVGSHNAHGRVLRGEPVVHVVDLQADAAHRDGDPIRRALVELGGGRVLLAVPLRKDDALLGIFTIYRREPHPFSDKQIVLLQNFAAQAVIAMDNARLLDEIRQRQAELRVTFDNMGDGVAMFDAGLELAAWNTNFQQILELPNEFLAARPSFAEYFGYLAKRGEYAATGLEAELGSGLDETERELRFERTRPDGRVVEVRRNPVPGGGFVLIYADITERKRAEAAIAAARDTAERALAELKTAQASLVHAEKMASLGQLTAGIAHEIKNPLNFVNNFAGLSVELLDELKEAAAPALRTLDSETGAEIDEIVATLTGNLEKIAEHGRRADGIVKSMLDHSRGGGSERRRVDLNALVEEALNLAYHGARAQDHEFTIALDRDFDSAAAPVELVPQDMTRVLLNLFANGFYAADKRRRAAADSGFRATLRVATRDLGEAVEIRVRDNGIGIAPEHRGRLFQPFFTTKPTGEGTGLGLSICWDVVTQEHGGTIAVDSAPGEFTEFTIRLPRLPSSSRPATFPLRGSAARSRY